MRQSLERKAKEEKRGKNRRGKKKKKRRDEKIAGEGCGSTYGRGYIIIKFFPL